MNTLIGTIIAAFDYLKMEASQGLRLAGAPHQTYTKETGRSIDIWLDDHPVVWQS